MITHEELQELLAYQSNNGVVISLYLDSDTAHENAETIKHQVKSMMREAEVDHEKAAAAIEQYLDLGYDWTMPGLAVFSGRGGDFFRVFPTAVAFRNRVRVGHKPYVKPLAHLLDFYAHYGVILVDRVGGRFFEYHLGELQGMEGYMGEEVHKLKQGAGSSAVGMRGGVGGGRHEEEVAHRNLRDTAAAAAHFFQGKPIRRLFLGGTSETVAEFRELLPKQLQSCLAGTFAMDMNAGEHEVRKHTLRLLQAANAEREEKLVDSWASTVARGGTAVAGLDDTLQAVSERRVQTLIISDGYRYPGYVDEPSGFLVANLAKSPLSADELTAVADVIDAACASTIDSGGHVEVIRDNARLEEYGRIGALLRY
jgi:peptide subunit release factor 1 (eRF1)